MCLACLAELERKIRGLPGIGNTKIQYPGDNLYQFYATPGVGWALAVVTYDGSRLTLDELLSLIRVQGYRPYKVVEKAGNRQAEAPTR